MHGKCRSASDLAPKLWRQCKLPTIARVERTMFSRDSEREGGDFFILLLSLTARKFFGNLDVSARHCCALQRNF